METADRASTRNPLECIQFQAPPHGAPVSSIIYDALRQAIIEGTLPDGMALRQEELARRFQTSRIPVREAISKLEQQGLVTTRRHRGAVVARITIEEFDEIFDLRALLEGEVIRRAVPAMSSETLAQARDFCDRFRASSDPAEWGALNRQFHIALYQAANLPNHMDLINTIFDRIDRYLRAQLSLTEGRNTAAIEHEQILQACVDGDAELAAELTRKHVMDAKGSLVGFLQRNDER